MENFTWYLWVNCVSADLSLSSPCVWFEVLLQLGICLGELQRGPDLDCSTSHTRASSQYRCRLTSISIPLLKIRRSQDRLIFNMGIPIPVNAVFILKWDPGSHSPYYASQPEVVQDEIVEQSRIRAALQASWAQWSGGELRARVSRNHMGWDT